MIHDDDDGLRLGGVELVRKKKGVLTTSVSLFEESRLSLPRVKVGALIVY